MIITSTALGFSSLSVGLFFMWIWFFYASKRASSGKNYSMSLITFSFLATTLHSSFLGFGFLFFAQNPPMLRTMFAISQILLTIFAVISLYGLFYTVFPKKSPIIPLFFIGSLGIFNFIFTLIEKIQPILRSSYIISWDMSLSVSLMTIYLLCVGIGSLGYIFAHLFFIAKTKEMKIISFIITLSAIAGSINTFSGSVILYNSSHAELRTTILTYGTLCIGILFILGILFAMLRGLSARR